MAPSVAQHRNLSPSDVNAGPTTTPPATTKSATTQQAPDCKAALQAQTYAAMAPSSRMNLASLLQPESDSSQRRPPAPTSSSAPAPPAPTQPLAPPPPPIPYTSNEPPSSYSQSHSHSYPQPSSNSNQNYTGSSSQYSHAYPPASQSHGSYHPPTNYTPSPTHTSQPAHHFHSHAHHHSHPLHPPQPHSHLSNHTHPHHHHHAHAHQHSHSHSHGHHQHHSLPHPHAHVHVIHNHPAPSASANPSSGPQPPAPPGPGSSSSVAGSPPGYGSSHFPNGPPPSSSRGPQPIIPITPAPRSPVAAYPAGASRSPTAPYSIYGAGSIISRPRSPMASDYSSSAPPPHGPSSSSGSRRNTLSGPGGPQPIDPVPLRDYPPYPGTASKHPDDNYPPSAFSAPAYSSRPQSPNTSTGTKNRRSGGGVNSTSSRNARSASVKRSIGGAAEAKRMTDRSREREKDERDLEREREDLMYREREKIAIEREREERRDREREYDEQARAVARERERERERERQHELEMRDSRRPPPPSKRIESEFSRRPPEDWDRMRERDRGRMPREPERDWRREQEDPRQGIASLAPTKHLPPLSHNYDGKQSHLHPIQPPLPQQSRASHHYARHPTPPPPSLPILSPVWLGTHVYPNLPFPVCLPPTLSRNNLSPEGYRPYQYTILVPSGFLPLQPAARIPRPTLPLWGNATTGYTDDSNLLLAAVHSGRTNWNDIRQARRHKSDAKIIVGVWVGGANGGRNAVRPKGGAWEGGQGSGQLWSSSWGNSHDGGGMEIIQVIWIEKDAAHAPHRPNRRERMEQYAKRRAYLDLVPPVKRDRIDTWYLDSDDEDAQIFTPAKRTWEIPETIVFGKGGTTSGFVYDPRALRSVVFEESNERSTKRLKSRSGQQGDENSTSGVSITRRDIVLENDDEQYILSLDNDKSKTYTLSTLSPKSKKTEVLRKSVTEEDVSFFDKGLCVWIKDDEAKKDKANAENEDMDNPEMPCDETMSNDRKGWFCRVNRWKFAPDTAETPTTVDAS
ncbi:unnamed protein product [Rhizoctonia solani]|uniref:Rxt3-domain-containing protein n=1 Tax=Rhizoctonia solani TaxID=456999 RepID=A0A8H2X923_9AGAM|nr:unnamed protein product [Rhizoctonia solani]